MKKERIIIKIDDENNTKSYDSNQIIQIDAKKAFLRKIDLFISKIENKQEKEIIEDRVHDTILINGKRGYGKTSFMLSMLDILNGKNKSDSYYKLEYKNYLHVFKILDPTIIETKENIFILVLSKISDLVKNCSRDNDHTDEEYKAVQNSLKEVAKGIKVLDGVGEERPLNQNLWNEPELILEDGLKNVRGGSQLEDNFKKLIFNSLKYINKKAFILVFDDIDTATNQGKMILELIRKYFTSRQLIVVMLGDIELYNLIIRDLQWKKLNPEMTNKYHESTIKDSYYSEIDTLANQYMLKVIKVENRIDLKNLSTYNDRIKVHNNNNTEALPLFINNIIEIEFNEKSNKKHMFIDYFLNQPVRTLISIMKSRNKEYFLHNLEHILKSQLSYKYKHTGLAKLLVALREKSDYRFFLLYKYIIYINKDKNIIVSPEFIPNLDDEDEKTLAVLLSAHIGNSVKNMQDMCDYGIKFFLPNAFNLKYDFNDHTLKIARYLVKDFDKPSIKKRVKNGIFYISQDEFLDINLTKKQQATFNILVVGLFQNQGMYNYLSFWNLFGFISNILKDKAIDFDRLLQVKSFDIRDNESEEIGSNIINEKEYDCSGIKKIANSNIEKNENYKINIKLSARQILSIWKRIQYTIKYIDDKPSDNFSDQLHRYIIGMLNAFIVVSLEEVEGITFNNVITLDARNNSIFKKNKDKLEENKSDYVWLYEFINLPIWELFMPINKINDTNSISKEYSLYDKLKEISIFKSNTLNDLVQNLSPLQKKRYKDILSNKFTSIKEFDLFEKAIKKEQKLGNYNLNEPNIIEEELSILKNRNDKILKVNELF